MQLLSSYFRGEGGIFKNVWLLYMYQINFTLNIFSACPVSCYSLWTLHLKMNLNLKTHWKQLSCSLSETWFHWTPGFFAITCSILFGFFAITCSILFGFFAITCSILSGFWFFHILVNTWMFDITHVFPIWCLILHMCSLFRCLILHMCSLFRCLILHMCTLFRCLILHMCPHLDVWYYTCVIVSPILMFDITHV